MPRRRASPWREPLCHEGCPRDSGACSTPPHFSPGLGRLVGGRSRWPSCGAVSGLPECLPPLSSAMTHRFFERCCLTGTGVGSGRGRGPDGGVLILVDLLRHGTAVYDEGRDSGRSSSNTLQQLADGLSDVAKCLGYECPHLCPEDGHPLESGERPCVQREIVRSRQGDFSGEEFYSGL